MAASQLALISKKIIKPSSPTPLIHRIQKLSIFDQLNPCSYMSYGLFFPKQCHPTLPDDPTHISTILENSLSRALTSYYPLAGTIRDEGLHVECNDVGAKFLQVKIDCPMSQIFDQKSTEAEDLVLPRDLPWTPSKENLVVAQLNHFNCGGIAIGVCVSHKVVDGSSMANFTHHWSTMARNPSAPIPSFQFVGGSHFPPVSSPIAEAILKSKTRGNNTCISKKYLLSRSKINSLKAMIAAESGNKSSSINPSSVEAASAFVYKCIASNSTKPSIFTQSVNLRPIMKKWLPEEFQGNASFLFMAPEISDPADIKLHRLISELRKEKEMYWETTNLMSTLLEKVKLLQNQLERDHDDEVDVYKCTSLSKFIFGQMDYGWGSPTRVCLGSVPINKKIFLTDSQTEDGIEVVVSLKQQQMSALETKSNLLEFASPL